MGGCEVNLRVQCSSADAAQTTPGSVLDISEQGRVGSGSEFFAKWAAECVEPATPDKSDTLQIVLAVVLSLLGAVGIVGALMLMKKKNVRLPCCKASVAESAPLDQPILDAEIDRPGSD